MKVSILIPCYNAEQWIGPAIESALAQTWAECEVIVVDDGSSDGSLWVIQSFGDAIRYETGPNRGGNVARNRLWQLAAGDWLQYLDADDYLLPGKVATHAACALAHPEADVVYSPVIMEHHSPGIAPRQEILPIDEPRDPWMLLVRWILPQTGTAFWRRAAIEAVGGWREDLPCCQEHDLYLRLLKAGKQFEYCDAPGAVYRQWSTGTVCRRNPAETFRRRLDVMRQAEQHLLETGQMTPTRQDALAHARLECARIVYHLDRASALQVVAETQRAHPQFTLPSAASFPLPYRWAYRWLGFSGAEQIASFTRALRQKCG